MFAWSQLYFEIPSEVELSSLQVLNVCWYPKH